MKRVLVSVSDKTGLIDFAKELTSLGYEIISTGGTQKSLDDAGIKTLGISAITNFPEIMDGRVKTLHPNVHGGLLCVRDNEEHLKALKDNNIDPIDMVVVNLYPFKETLSKKGVSHEELIENIDIGGPSMLRSAAKNYKFVTVLTDPKDYDRVVQELKSTGDTTLETREQLAAKVFRHTASYDSLIASYLTTKVGEEFPESITLSYEKVQDLRYGENPHQHAGFYKSAFVGYSMANAEQLHGKELSYNNIQDANAALEILKEFDEPTVVAVKHMNPCGVGIASDLNKAWDKAYQADPLSIFGGIVVTNQEITQEVAEKMGQIFLEIIIAPNYTKDAFEILSTKKNIRLMTLNIDTEPKHKKKVVSVMDGLLIQDIDQNKIDINLWKVVTEREPTEEEMNNLLFTWKMVKHVKSNAIVIGKNGQSLGIGAGQMNRVGAALLALEQGGEECKDAVLASDAFFPMADTVELAAKYGIKAIVQPGGSIKDNLSIEECNKHGITMVFTDTRHFKH